MLMYMFASIFQKFRIGKSLKAHSHYKHNHNYNYISIHTNKR